MQATSDSEIIIVGAGPAGLSAAAELSRTHRNITVLEEDSTYVGGISRTVRYKDFRFDIGGHRFFSKSQEISQWWTNRLKCDLLRVKRRSRILYRNKLYDYPLRPFDALRKLGLITSIGCVGSYAWSNIWPKASESTFEDWVSNRFGGKLFRIFFKTYTEKVWGMPCSRISADWASQRIRNLTLPQAITSSLRRRRRGGPVIKTLIDEFAYPRLGPGMMWERVRDDVIQSGVSIVMGKKVTEILRTNYGLRGVRTLDDAGRLEQWNADHFILSMPLRDTVLCMSPSLPQPVVNAAKALKYRDFIMVAVIIPDDGRFVDNWLYIHDPNVLVARVQNFKNWSVDMVPVRDVTCLGFEYFCDKAGWLWNLSNDEMVDLAKRELSTIGLARGDAVVDACVVRVEKAYPVYDTEYNGHVGSIRKELLNLPNLQVIGRNGMHKYNNQDHSMMTGLLAARNLCGGNWDPWNVNGDAEYHEVQQVRVSGRYCPIQVADKES